MEFIELYWSSKFLPTGEREIDKSVIVNPAHIVTIEPIETKKYIGVDMPSNKIDKDWIMYKQHHVILKDGREFICDWYAKVDIEDTG